MKTHPVLNGSLLNFLCLFRAICHSPRSSLGAFALAVVLVSGCRSVREKPDDFVELVRVVPSLALDIRYATTNNFGSSLIPVAGGFVA